MDVSPLDEALLDGIVRLVRLIEAPADAPVLQPLITRKLIYRLLVGEPGARLRYMATLEGATPAITRAVGRIRHALDQPLDIADLAQDLGMSGSGFHHHFKAVTAMSPLQFQKQLRLQKARQLLLGEHLEAATAAARVGDQDAAYFNREYKSLFGQPLAHYLLPRRALADPPGAPPRRFSAPSRGRSGRTEFAKKPCPARRHPPRCLGCVLPLPRQRAICHHPARQPEHPQRQRYQHAPDAHRRYCLHRRLRPVPLLLAHRDNRLDAPARRLRPPDLLRWLRGAVPTQP